MNDFMIISFIKQAIVNKIANENVTYTHKCEYLERMHKAGIIDQSEFEHLAWFMSVLHRRNEK